MGHRWASAACAAFLMATGMPARAAGPAAPVPAVAASGQLHHGGVDLRFELRPAGRSRELMEGEFADVRFELRDETSGQPLRGLGPGAWLDMAQVIAGQGADQRSCKDKIALYLKGAIGIRPMVDLNSYYVLLMNADASISVVDPVVRMAGVTSTLANVPLQSPPADWAAADRDRRLYVSQPRAGLVAVMDTENFQILAQWPAGKRPLRTALQADQRRLWVGNDAEGADSGVTILDVDGGKPLGFIHTGAGHHEIAFAADGRLALVTNRAAGTVSLVDVASRALVTQLETGPQPLGLAVSALSARAYVSDGKAGHVTVIDTERRRIVRHIALQAGLGPLRTTPDGRYLLALNPLQDRVSVIDTASDELVQEIEVTGQPFQLAFSSSYAYVRSLHAERVAMIALASLGRGRQAAVQHFVAGDRPPYTNVNMAGPAVADAMVNAVGEGSMFVLNPADGSTYYYMEGMNAPSSSYRVHGSSPRAVTVVDRSLKEVEPGVYAGRVRLPVGGRYDVAFMLQQPQVLHCFAAEVQANVAAARQGPPLVVQFEPFPRRVPVGQTQVLRFRVSDPVSGQPLEGLRGLSAAYFLAPGRSRSAVTAVERGGGLYEVQIPLRSAGAWYVYLGRPSQRIAYGVLPYASMIAEAAPAQAAAQAVHADLAPGDAGQAGAAEPSR